VKKTKKKIIMLVNMIEIISMLIFFTLIGIRLFLKRRAIKVRSVIIFEYSKKYTQKINEVVYKHRKIFKILGILSIISAPILMIIGVYFVINSLIQFKPSLALVLPSASGFRYPGPIISVPFWIWLIAIFIIIFFHESMHALIAANEGIKTKRYGLLYFLVIPIGAFVDLDKKKLKKLNIKSKIKIFAAGSLGNIIAFGIFLLILIASSHIINLTIESKGVWFNNTAPNSPAESVGLKGIIVKIDNKTINNIYDLQEFLRNTKPNTTITIETTEGKYRLQLAERENASYIGIVNVKNHIVYKGSNNAVPDNLLLLINYFLMTIQWIMFLNLGVAIANMLPIIPLDGGLIIRENLIKIFGKNGEKASKLISLTFLVLIIFSLFVTTLTLRVAS
jgi:membrane-associated protease RseP (regulator of RpoE activity)